MAQPADNKKTKGDDVWPKALLLNKVSALTFQCVMYVLLFVIYMVNI